MELWNKSDALTKAAAILFVVGKLHSLPAIGFTLIGHPLATFFIAIYAASIFTSVVMAFTSFFKQKEKKTSTANFV